jgi:hypothetical protein
MYICVCRYVRMYVCNVRMYVCNLCMYACTYVCDMCVCMYVCMYACYVSMYVCTYAMYAFSMGMLVYTKVWITTRMHNIKDIG